MTKTRISNEARFAFASIRSLFVAGEVIPQADRKYALRHAHNARHALAAMREQNIGAIRLDGEWIWPEMIRNDGFWAQEAAEHFHG